MTPTAVEDWHGPLDYTAAISRFGVAYVRNVCAHAHIGFSETSPTEDALALDGTLDFDSVGIRIQVKATTKWQLTSRAKTLVFPIEPEWREKWLKQRNPAFIVVILVSKEIPAWISHGTGSTRLAAYALWARIDKIDPNATSVTLSKSQRFTASTLGEWAQMIDALYSANGAAS